MPEETVAPVEVAEETVDTQATTEKEEQLMLYQRRLDNHDWLWGINGNPYFYAYRYFGDTDNTSTDYNDGDVTSVARDVLAGDWGNGRERIDRLTEAGYDADAVQREVNRLVSGQSSIDLEQVAREVLAGEWGNGQERVDRLTAAGYDYQEIQDIVNSWL